jgi:hypothetical protein
MKIDNCLVQQQLHCAEHSAGRAWRAAQSDTDHDLAFGKTKQIGGVCLSEMCDEHCAGQDVLESKAVQRSTLRFKLKVHLDQ